MTAEEFLESKGFVFEPKDKYELWKEETWCSNYNEHKIKEIFELMEQYANDKVNKRESELIKEIEEKQKECDPGDIEAVIWYGKFIELIKKK